MHSTTPQDTPSGTLHLVLWFVPHLVLPRPKYVKKLASEPSDQSLAPDKDFLHTKTRTLCGAIFVDFSTTLIVQKLYKFLLLE